MKCNYLFFKKIKKSPGSQFVLHFNEKGQYIYRKEINEIDLSQKDLDDYTLIHFAALENQQFVISIYWDRHYDILVVLA